VSLLVCAVRDSLAPAPGSPDWDRVERAASARVEEIIGSCRHMVQDAPSEQWLRTCATVLATYQELKPFVDGPRLVSLFLDAMAAPFRQRVTSYLESRFGILDDAPEEAFARISENFQRRGEQRFGLAFRYATDIRDHERNFVNIERCFFNEFFRANGAPEVTSIFCALDKVWAEALEQPRYGVRFERPTTLAGGADACRFQFSRSPAR
jgi:hypothetical protein